MKSLLNNFCKYTVAMAVLGIVSPQITWAGGKSKHNQSAKDVADPNGNTDAAGTELPQPGSKWLKHLQKDKKVIAAPNGNTGINGTGLPPSGSKWLKRLQKDKKVIAAPNGNTGINGTGLPQSGVNSTGMSKKDGSNKLAKLKQKLNQEKPGDGKKGPTQADLDAQAAADKAYVAAQNAASVSRGQLGGAQGEFDRADADARAAYEAYQKNNTPQTSKAYYDATDIRNGAANRLASYSLDNNKHIAAVNSASFLKTNADAKVQAATPMNKSGGSSKMTKPNQKPNQGKPGDGKKGPTQADLDAQKGADAAYVQAQNAASVSRGQLGGAQGRFELAETQTAAAWKAYSVAHTPEALKAYKDAKANKDQAAYNVGLLNRDYNEHIAIVGSASAKKIDADAKVQAATPIDNAGGGNGKSTGNGHPAN